MAKKKKIRIPFDVDAWLNDENVNAMTDAQQGVYVRLLCWLKKHEGAGIEADDASIIKLLKCDPTDFEWIKLRVLYVKGYKYYQKRLKWDHDLEEEKNLKKKPPEALRALRKKCELLWREFYLREIGHEAPSKLFSYEKKALNELVDILKTAKLNNTDEDVIRSFQIIFDNWNLLELKTQQYIKLNQILSNLAIIRRTLTQQSKSPKFKSHAAQRIDQSMQLEKMIRDKYAKPAEQTN